MKELNMSWEEIKKIPRVELDGLLLAFKNYTNIHAFDGYNEKDVAEMSKNKPEIRQQYAYSKRLRKTFELKAGVKKREVITSLSQALR
jgi:hypothetical protein|tara:strand:+ start:285 stop:548 length:264 start_codon:yes stop_codon:yes gene_type:complete